jgi:hypothetical protein
LIPIDTLLGLFGRHDINKTTAKRIEVIRALDVPVQRSRLKLREQKDAVNL